MPTDLEPRMMPSPQLKFKLETCTSTSAEATFVAAESMKRGGQIPAREPPEAGSQWSRTDPNVGQATGDLPVSEDLGSIT